MPSDYALVSRWTVPVGLDALWDVVEELLATDDPLVWWPAVRTVAYDNGRLRVHVSSGLGYGLDVVLDDLEARRPSTLTFSARGDLRGAGMVRFVPVSQAGTMLEIDWRVAADRRWMRWTGWLLRPVFVLGHRLVMRRGEARLRAWLGARDSPGPRRVV